MSDVLPPSNQESLTSGPNVPAKNQAAIERLRKRMENYRDIQTSRLPEYEQTMNHMNTQQMQETLVLRQKYLESKAKKPNKKSSSSANVDKMKHDMATVGQGPNMNGIMPQYHAHPQGPGPMNGPPMGPGPHMNGPPPQMNLNGPPAQNGPPMMQNGPTMNHGPNGQSHNKRPLDDDSSSIQTDTAKRLNLDNGNISDQNFIKREPSPLETKFNPGGGGFGGPPGSHPPNHSSSNLPPTPASSQPPSHLPDVKPNVNSLNQEMKDSSASALSKSQSDNKLKTEVSDTKDDLKTEQLGESLKQEDPLDGDLDFKDFDFDGMNADSLQDLMDDLPENFIDTFDFENSKIASDEKDSEELGGSGVEPSENGGNVALGGNVPMSSVSSCHSASATTTTVSGQPGTNNTPAAETLKMMAQQHQQPPSSMPSGPHPHPQGGPPGPPFQGGPPMNPNTSMPSYQPQNSHSAMNSMNPSGVNPSMVSSMSSMPTMTNSMSDTTGASQNMMGVPRPGPGGPHPGGPHMDVDPRLRAAVQTRYRHGNPHSIANSNSMGPGGAGGNPSMNTMNTHPGMMGAHQRMAMGNNGMMGNMPSNQQGPGPGNMQMMSQQQVCNIFKTR